MQCPRLHGTLETVLLNSDISEPQYAYLCPECHGVWMRAMECRDFLGFESEMLLPHTSRATVDLPYPHCQHPAHIVDIELDNKERLKFYVCPRCFSVFFDATQFAQAFYQQLKAERSISDMLAHSPLDHFGLTCCDCGAEIKTLDEAHDAGIGYCCNKCHQTPPILSENKIQNVQLVTFHGMEVKIDHGMASSFSRISVTPVEPCQLDVHLFSLSPLKRVLSMGYRKMRFHGTLGHHLDASQDNKHKTPWHVFLRQRGVTHCIEIMAALGSIDVAFKPHSIIFELNAKRVGTDTKLKFETAVRRMLIAYERFVKLAKRYEHPEETDEAEQGKDVLQDT